jgi:peptide deformylase
MLAPSPLGPYFAKMAIREILEVPDSRLKIVSTVVEPHEFGSDLATLVDDMFETMYDAPGIGLAAIQGGVPQRVLVIDLQPDDPDAQPAHALNPPFRGRASAAAPASAKAHKSPASARSPAQG